MANRVRTKKLQTKRHRQEKLRKMRDKYRLGSKSDQQSVLEKLKRVAPWLSEEEFLSPLKSSQKAE